jgi:hypothetical protein
MALDAVGFMTAEIAAAMLSAPRSAANAIPSTSRSIVTLPTPRTKLARPPARGNGDVLVAADERVDALAAEDEVIGAARVPEYSIT